MSDLFHERRARGLHRGRAKVMAAGDWHTYQVLTKRSERPAVTCCSDLYFAAGKHIFGGA